MRMFVASTVLVSVLASAAVAQEGKPRVLVVDIEEVLSESEEGKEILSNLRQRLAEKESELKDAENELKKLKEELQSKTLADRTPDFYEKRKHLIDRAVKLQAEANFFSEKLRDEVTRRQQDLVRATRVAAEKVMEDRGADLVITSRTKKISYENDKSLEFDMMFRRVLCVSKEADITADVVKLLNEDYRERKAAGAVKKDAPKKEN